MKKTLLFLTLAFFTFCGGRDSALSPPAESQEAVHTSESHEHEELHLSQEKQKDWGIQVAEVQKQKVGSQAVLPGIITLNENRTAHISSYVRGKVASLSTDLGAQVEKGQALITINSPEFAQAQADFLQAYANLNLSHKEHERAKALWKEKAIEEKEYLRREAEYKKLSTEYGTRESNLHSYGLNHAQIEALLSKCGPAERAERLCELADPLLPILSPLKGTIIFRDIILGEHVEPDKILFTASDLHTLWAILDAYEKDLPLIHKTDSVVIQTPLYPEKKFSGKIGYISDLVDEKLRTIKIRVEVDNREGLLKPNLYIQGFLENKNSKSQILAVPEEAIQNFNGQKIVFVLEEDGAFAVRPVLLGGKAGSLRVLSAGLEEGEHIVVKGAFNLKAEMTKETFGHGHVH